MNKVSTLIFCLALIPMLFARPNKDVVSRKPYDPDSRINPHPCTGPVHIDDGRALGDILLTIDLAAIGMPGDGNDNAGLTWDGTYLYLVNMYDNNVYVIDPTGPSIDTSWSAPPSLSWGCGHEQNLWITESNTAYEYTYDGSATGNSFNCGSFMADVSEWYPGAYIWILAVGGTNRAYKFEVPGGTCVDDIGDPAWTSISQRGLTYDPFNDKFFVGGWNSNMVWEINTDGTPTGRQFSFNNVASLAYDWQSTLHPKPVLWVATNDAVNQIYMVDPDNPQPATTLLWDFETGWQGWIHTNPAGWDVVWSGINPPPPFAGDSSMWIDSDGSGGGCSDTALSPVVVPPANMSLLKYGYYNYGGSGSYINELHVGIKYFTGGVWNVVELQLYPAGATSGPAWDSVDISGYAASDSVQVYFYYTDLGTWGFDSAFDNVMIMLTGIVEKTITQTPLVFGFAPNMPTLTKYPVISYTTTTPGKICLKVYDSTGRLIKTLVNHQNEPAGAKTVFWNGKDDKFRNVANGIYFLKLDAEEKSATHKLIYIK